MDPRSPEARCCTLLALAFLLAAAPGRAQTAVQATDSNTPLHLLRPDYPVPYGPVAPEKVTEVLQRVRGYLETATAARLVDGKSGAEISGPVTDDAVIPPGQFRIISYEWGVTYSGMLLAAETTGDARFNEYVSRRMKVVTDLLPREQARLAKNPAAPSPLRSVLKPRALDDAGAMCAAMIKAERSGAAAGLRALIDNYIDYISAKEFRLADGTLARNRPQPNTIWLDDLYMSVPALAQMGQLTGERRYFDDGVKQVLQFAARMFDKERGLFMHGWVQGMEVHPQFHWARANGWALLTMVELLDVLPEEHPGRPAVLELLRAHIQGLAARQSGSGFWHQLLDREDSYLETSATAIYAYGIARAVDQGWIDPLAYGPVALLAWHAVSTKVNAQGQVEGTCVGTGMGFEPAFYYHRPTSPFAAHGYGPVLLAGAEILRLLKTFNVEINDSSTQFYRRQAASRIDFGPGPAAPGFTQVLPQTVFDSRRGFGFDLGSSVSCLDRGGEDALRGDLCTGDVGFYFSVAVPEGNYRVKLTLGDASAASATTVKAESRRLLLENVKTAPGSFEVRSFTVNVRSSRLPDGGSVRLNAREQGVLHWDDKLTLEFGGERPALAALEIEKVDNAVTVFLAGDSTVTDQSREPWAAWGQMLPRFFGPEVAVANHAESGETLVAFRNENRLAKLMSLVKPGDYVFLQFAHNDQKPGPNHLDAFTTYKQHLKLVIGEVRAKGATPVLVTSMPRRRFDEQGRIVNSLEDYPEAVRQTAREEAVALVDLFAAGTTLFEALGPEASKKAFVHYPAGSFPGQNEELKDDTHFSTYGAYELAKAVVAGIRGSNLPLAKHLVDAGPFDPTHPDPPEAFRLPLSPPLPALAPLAANATAGR